MSKRVQVSLSDPVFAYVDAEARRFGVSSADRLRSYAEERFARTPLEKPKPTLIEKPKRVSVADQKADAMRLRLLNTARYRDGSFPCDEFGKRMTWKRYIVWRRNNPHPDPVSVEAELQAFIDARELFYTEAGVDLPEWDQVD